MSEPKLTYFKLTDYDIGDTIRLVPYGRIKIAKNKRSNELIALEIIKKSQIISSKKYSYFLNEIKILPELSHSSISKFIGFASDDKYLYFAFEFIEGGDLFSILKVDNNFSLEKTKFYSGQMIFVLEYLHSKNIIYRNIKPENILISKNGYIKIVDFQLMKKIDGITYTMCGTPEYFAPEVILGRGYGLGADWWAFGILLYEMICGIDPFSDDDPMKIFSNILEGDIKFTSDFDEESKDLIKHLLEPNISQRYGNLRNGVDDIKNHDFFNGINLDKLLRQEIEAPFIPKIKGDNIIKYYEHYPDSDDNAEPVNKSKDPFNEL